MRKNNRILYEYVIANTRAKYRRFNYMKVKK